MSRSAITVLGPRSADELGVTLPHEHLLGEFLCRYRPSEDEEAVGDGLGLASRALLLRDPAGYRVNLDARQVEAAVAECRWFKEAGGSTIVDLTAVGLSPDPVGLCEVSRRAGLNIIAATGLYIDESLPAWVEELSLNQLANKLADDILTGGSEGVRRGAIGEVAVESGSALELKCIRAAAMAQLATGAPCFFHVMSGILPGFRDLTDELISIYVEEGADLGKLVLCHQDGSGTDPSYQERLLKRGLWVEYDTFGSEGVFAFGKEYIQLPTDTQRIQEVAALIQKGFLSQILISHDICYQTARRERGGWGFTHILETLRPRFHAEGVTEDLLLALLRDNPARLFAFAD